VIRERVGQVAFTVTPLKSAIDMLLSDSEALLNNQRKQGYAVHFCNAYSVAIASRDQQYREVLDASQTVFSDGVPITWVGRRLRPDLRDSWERVYGPDVMTGVLEKSTTENARHFLLGATPEVLSSLEERIRERFPVAEVVGAESPPFRPLTADEQVAQDARIASSGATMVWVGLGTPIQDFEAARLAERLPVIALGVGAAFDFLAGTTLQAPKWMQRSGTEWLFRLGTEPRRLAKRYVWGNSVFALEAIRTLRNY
jgi:N-acetylglucosaminyldiphosphoundecaprenol N-acetyl-beta-D-mannosaminyltransferase